MATFRWNRDVAATNQSNSHTMDEKIILKPVPEYLCDTGKEIEPDKTYLCETGSSFEITIRLTGAQIQAGYHSGKCDADVEALMEIPSIKEQLDSIKDDDLNAWWMTDMFIDDTPEEHAAATREQRLAWVVFDCCANAIDGYCYEMK